MTLKDKINKSLKAAKAANKNSPDSDVTDLGRLTPDTRLLAFDAILNRFEEDSRPIDEEHAQELAESIVAVGLIQPIAIDNKGRMLAGSHRKYALGLIYENAEERKDYKATWDNEFKDELIPVKVFDFDAEKHPDKALMVEAAENEKRKDYKPAEIKALAERLEEKGYVKTTGRPRKGQKSLMKALTVITGKNRNKVLRLLEKADAIDSGTTATGGGDAVDKNKILLKPMRAIAKALTLDEFSPTEKADLIAALKKLKKLCDAEEAKNILVGIREIEEAVKAAKKQA